MVNKTDTPSNVLEHLFTIFNKRKIKYVVARRYDRLPEATLGGDVDIFVIPEDFDECMYICNQLGFSSLIYSSSKDDNSIISNAFVALKGAIYNPRKATEMLIASPSDVVDLIHGPQHQLYRSRKLYQDDLPLEICDHLTYTSPYDGSQIRVDQSIEHSLFNHRRLYNGIYVPSPPDELAHIIPHCVFDKGGYFSDYYIDRCDMLVDEVTTDTQYDDHFRELLSCLFYGADELMYELVTSGEYNSIRSHLRRFDDY